MKATQWKGGNDPKKWPSDSCVGSAYEFAREHVEDVEHTAPPVRRACARFLSDLGSDKWRFMPEWAERAMRFFEKLPPPSGEQFGRTMKCLPHQRFLIANVEGFRRRESPPQDWLPPPRRFTEAGLWTARKSGKSATAGAYGLQDLTIEMRRHARVIAVSSNEKQAMHIVNSAINIVRAAQPFRERFSLEASNLQILRRDEMGGMLHAVSGQPQSLDGHRPTLVLLDEPHAILSMDLLSVMRTAFGSSYNPLLLATSTCGTRLDSIGYALWESHKDAATGDTDLEHVFGLVFSPDNKAEDFDPFNPKFWYQANQGLGLTVPMSYYEAEAADARRSDERRDFFITRQVNVWTPDLLTFWMDQEAWEALHEGRTLEDVAVDSKRCWIGVDAASVNDLFAIAILLDTDPPFVGYVILMPQEAYQDRLAKGERHWQRWRENGWIEVCGGGRIDEDEAAERIVELAVQYRAHCIIFDQYARAGRIAGKLGRIRGLARVAPKTARFTTEPCREIEASVLNGHGLEQDGNPCAAWCFGNVVVERRRDESILPTKITAMSPRKIDAVDATVLAYLGKIHGKAGLDVNVVKTPGQAPMPRAL